MAAVTDAISGATSFPSIWQSFKATQRDTKQFAQNILDEVRLGRITDDGDIKRAAESIIAAQNSLIEDTYTDSKWQGKTSGITTYLPDVSLKAQQDAKISHLPLGGIANDASQYYSIENKHFVLDDFDTLIAILKTFQRTMPKQLFQNLDRARSEVGLSANQDAYTKSLAHLKAAAETALQTPEMQKERANEDPTDYRQSTEPNDSEWHRFANELVERGVYHHTPEGD